MYYLHILALWNLCVAQPILDLLSRHPEFFIARHSGPEEIILLVVILCFWLPLSLLVFDVIFKRISSALARSYSDVLIGIMIMALSLQYLKLLGLQLPGSALLVLAFIMVVVFLIAYFRTQLVKNIITISSVAILIIPVQFLFFSPVKSFVLTPEQHHIAGIPAKNDYPNIIFIVLDEFPLLALLDENGEIDAVRFPEFSRLAKKATWFRNGSTVRAFTHDSLKAIVTGQIPLEQRDLVLPTATDVPENLFTYLGNTYDRHIYEYLTAFCPKLLCGSSFALSSNHTCLALNDMAVLYLHVLLPDDLKMGLPEINNRWSDFQDEPLICQKYLFWAEQDIERDRAQRFKNFIAEIKHQDKPTVYFIHTNLPHGKWDYMPDGQSSKPVKNRYLRHLLQIGFVDTLLGRLLDQLQAEGIFDSSLIIVTADHGISFNSRKPLRETNKPEVIQDILNIPFFIKQPFQTDGEISDRNVETIDIVPTIADILDVQLPWEVDGESVLKTSLERPYKTLIHENGVRELLPPRFPVISLGLQMKLDLFGSGTTWSELVEKHE